MWFGHGSNDSSQFNRDNDDRLEGGGTDFQTTPRSTFQSFCVLRLWDLSSLGRLVSLKFHKYKRSVWKWGASVVHPKMATPIEKMKIGHHIWEYLRIGWREHLQDQDLPPTFHSTFLRPELQVPLQRCTRFPDRRVDRWPQQQKVSVLVGAQGGCSKGTLGL